MDVQDTTVRVGRVGCRAELIGVADRLAFIATHCSPHLNQFQLS